MKRCPECRRDYFDETLNFCLDDGAALVYGSGSDEHITAILPGDTASEAPTRTFDPADASTRRAGKTDADGRVSSWPTKHRFLLIGAAALVLAVAGFMGFRNMSAGDRRIDSVAVMPLVNTSGNADMEYLSDGITESLINSLSNTPDLAVKARSSVFAYKGKEINPQQIARDLSVHAILNGRIAQRGDSVTLNLELVDASTGNQLWGEQYNRKLTDLATLQSEIARDVARKLQTRLTGSDTQKIARSYTENTEAYQLYLKGKYHWNKRTGADLLKSIGYFEQAIEKDPAYALAYSGLAEAYILLPTYANESPQVAYSKARAAAAKALEIDDSLAEAHTAMAGIMTEHDWNFAGAEPEYLKAIELNPNYANARHWYGEYLLAMGRIPEALAQLKKAQELDPLSLIINGLLGVAYQLNGQMDEATEQIRRTIDMDPNFPRSHIFMAEIYHEKGMYEEAADEYAKLSLLLGAPAEEVSRSLALLKEEYRKGGPRAYHRTFAGFLQARRDQKLRHSPPPVTVVAAHWAKAGETEKALALLEEGFDRREPDMVRIKRPDLEPVKTHPRYLDIVRKMGLPQ